VKRKVLAYGYLTELTYVSLNFVNILLSLINQSTNRLFVIKHITLWHFMRYCNGRNKQT